MRDFLFMVYSVYILFSQQVNKYYVGHTGDLERRINEHNTGQTRFTSNTANDWQLVHKEDFATRSEAMIREREIKAKKSRLYIERLITKG